MSNVMSELIIRYIMNECIMKRQGPVVAGDRSPAGFCLKRIPRDDPMFFRCIDHVELLNRSPFTDSRVLIADLA
jgi:hypothetical protein